MSMLVIGRVIGPEATGTGMIAVAAFMILDVAGATMFTDAVVQHPRLTPRHAGSALIGATLVGCVAALILAIGAPFLANSAEAPAVAGLALALAPLLPISAFAGCASGLVLREQRFMLLATRVLLGQPLALAVGLGLAANGYGAWAMVGNQVVATIAAFLLLAIFGRFAARPAIDRASLADLWPVAGPQVVAVFVMVGRYRLFLLALGLVTTEAVLAVSHFAFRMLDAALVMVWQATSRIAMPRLCALQGDDHAQAEAFGDLAQLQALLGMPLAAGIALTAPDLVQALLGPAWYQTAHAAQIVGITAVVTFVHGDTTSLFVARGKARRNVTIAAVATIIPLTALAVFQPATPSGVAMAWASQALIMPPILTWMVLREVKRPITWLLARIAPAIVATGALAATVIALELTLKMSAMAELLAAAALGSTVYVAVAWMMLRGHWPRALARRAAPLAAE